MKYTLTHVPGFSAYDHFASEVIRRVIARELKTKTAIERAIIGEFRRILGRPAIGPRIDVVNFKRS